MSFGVRAMDSSGSVTFDSTAEHVLFYRDEQTIPAGSVGAGITFAYPDLTGRKIAAFLQSPFTVGSIIGYAIQSCRVSYPGGIPTVSVFFDNTTDTAPSPYTLPKADGHLTVMYCGT